MFQKESPRNPVLGERHHRLLPKRPPALTPIPRVMLADTDRPTEPAETKHVVRMASSD